MDYFVGLDVSVKETSVCIVDDAGKIVREVRVASEPEALLQVLTNTIYRFKRVGLEAGPLSQWLYSVLAEAGLPVICVETRHMRAMLKAQINKTDRNDARGIAQMMCKIWYLISRTVSDDDPHCGDIDDRSVRVFAVKPAPSARRDAALGLTARRGRANPATMPLMHSLRCSGNHGTPLSDNVRQVECWFSQMMRVGLYRPVHVKTLRSQKLRVLLTHRKLLQSKAIAIENDLRATLRNFGLKVGMVGTVKFEARIRELVENLPDLAALVEPLLIVRRVVREQLGILHSRLLAIVRDDDVCRRLMTVPGVGPVVALTYRVTVDVPARFRKSKAVGAVFPIGNTQWMRQVLGRGEAYIGKDRADIRDVFFDYELIWSLGCESVLNLPRARW